MKSAHKGNVNQAGDVSLVIRELQNGSGWKGGSRTSGGHLGQPPAQAGPPHVYWPNTGGYFHYMHNPSSECELISMHRRDKPRTHCEDVS